MQGNSLTMLKNTPILFLKQTVLEEKFNIHYKIFPLPSSTVS